MAQFYVSFIATATYYTEIEADSREEAGEIAWDMGVPSLCHQEKIEIAGDWDIDEIEEVI